MRQTATRFWLVSGRQSAVWDCSFADKTVAKRDGIERSGGQGIGPDEHECRA